MTLSCDACRHADHEALRPAAEFTPRTYPPPDNEARYLGQARQQGSHVCMAWPPRPARTHPFPARPWEEAGGSAGEPAAAGLQLENFVPRGQTRRCWARAPDT